MAGEQTLAQKVRAKYPGAYDALSDQQLEAKVIAKYPGTYDHVPRTPEAKTAQTPPHAPARSVLADAAIGAVKGAGRTVAGLGELVHEIPGVSSAVDALYGQPGLSKASFQGAREVTEPTNTAQRVGMGVEQIGEFFVPVGAAGKVKTAAEIGKSAILTRAQTGSTGAAGVSAGLSAALPGVAKLATMASGKLASGAQQTITQALGATKEWAKAEAAKLAPQILKRGIHGSRETMLSLATTTAQRVGAELNAAYKAAAEAGEAISGDVIRGHLQITRDALLVKAVNGKRVAVPGTERVVKQLDKLDTFVASLGSDIPVDKAAHLKRTWDAIVDKAGLYGQKSGASATDAADAWAYRESAGAFRELLNANPTIGALNKELSFWAGLKNVLQSTELRKTAQSGGLVAAGSAATGATIGAMSGDSTSDKVTKSILGGLAGRQFTKMVQSPWWQTTVSAPVKQALADALASGQPAKVIQVLDRTMRALPAQLQTAAAQ